MKNLAKNKGGFTLLETVMYLSIATILMITISVLVLSIFNARRYFIAINNVNYNARFIIHYLTNRMHNVDQVVDVSPAIEKFHFYQIPSTRFSIEVSGGDLVYREGQDTGTGFPEQSSLEPIILNNPNITVSNLSLIGTSDYLGVVNQGMQINFTLTSGAASDQSGYYEKDFSTFISIR